ncbi:MAG: zinc ABC transporter substrate-binding protein [Candidatus Micrarchaeota archaeon]
MVRWILLSVLVFAFLFVGCTSDSSEGTKREGKIDVIVSILPQKEFVKAVGGDNVEVHELISPGSSPATYEPSPQDLVKVEQADVYFRIGHIPFEKSHVNGFSYLNPDMLIVDTSMGITPRYFGEDEGNHHEGVEEGHNHLGIDPHIWLSPKLVVVQVERIYDALAEIDPENSAEYRKNADDYISRLNKVDEELRISFSSIKTRKLMVFHPAWGYFADNYGLEQIAIEQDGKEPTAEQLKHIIDEAKKENIKVIFVQKQFSTMVAASIAEEIGCVVVPLDPLAENYIENMRTMGKVISEFGK